MQVKNMRANMGLGHHCQNISFLQIPTICNLDQTLLNLNPVDCRSIQIHI
nr:MAG TPA: hypothetical protein [Caudoviricetes sp.]